MKGGAYCLVVTPWLDAALAHSDERARLRPLRASLRAAVEHVFLDEHRHVLLDAASVVDRMLSLGIHRAYAVVPPGACDVDDVRIQLRRPGQPALELSATVLPVPTRRSGTGDRVTWSMHRQQTPLEPDLDLVAAAAELRAALAQAVGGLGEDDQSRRRLTAAQEALSGRAPRRELTPEHPAAARTLSRVGREVEVLAAEPGLLVGAAADTSDIAARLGCAALRARLVAANVRGLPDRPLG